MIEDVGGIVGNFERRQEIEEQVRETRTVGRTEPRTTEPESGAEEGVECEERLLDEQA